MEFLIKILALVVGAQLMQDPDACNCSKLEQNYIMSNEPVVIHIRDIGKKCKLELDAELIITPETGDGVFDEFIISLHSSNRGLISKQIVHGAKTIHVQDDLILKKNEKLWIVINPQNDNQYLVNSLLTRK